MRMSDHPTIADLRGEFVNNGLEGWLWQWLYKRLVTYVWVRLVPLYKPSIYSPTGGWNEEGINDLVNEFIMVRAIDRGTLLAALQQANTVRGVVRYLERSFHNFAVAQRRRTVAGNIWSRLSELLADDATFRPLAGAGARAAYGLDTWAENPPPQVTDEEIAQASRWLPADLKWVEYDSEARLSPGLASQDLRRVAERLMTNTHRLWSAHQILRVLQTRFDLTPDDEALSDEDLRDTSTLADPALPPLEELAAAELARHVLESLTPRQRQILPLLAEHPPLGVREIAQRLGLSKSLIANERQAIIATLQRFHVTGPAEHSQLLDAASQLLHA
jgi:DNA-binding CsgD family transcriptional regulator